MTPSFDLIRPSSQPLARPAAPITLDASPPRADDPFGPYVLSPQLATTVNVALALDQPLLVTGDPGCGKTALAWAVATQLGCPVLEFHTKSTSTARDLLYQVDSLRRFHDASTGDARAREAGHYPAPRRSQPATCGRSALLRAAAATAVLGQVITTSASSVRAGNPGRAEGG